MNGVTILDTIEIYNVSGWQFVLGMVPLILGAIICFVRMYIAYNKGTEEEKANMMISYKHWSPKELLVVVLGCILSVVLMVCMQKFCPADHVETQYEVSVDKTVSLVDFYDRYTIIEERTDTFLVKEREK